MIKTYYHRESDYAELFFQKSVENYGEVSSKYPYVTEFKSEETDVIVGYGIENVSLKFDQIDFLEAKVKLALMLRVSRMRQKYTIDHMTKLLGISEKQYRRLENAETEATVSYLAKLPRVFEDFDLNLLAS